MAMYPALRHYVQPSSDSWYGKYYRGGDGYQGRWTRSLFWMWMAAFFGMATKYAEGLLAIKYRTKDDHGAVAGGPMHYILLGMGEKWRPLAIFFALAGVLVALLGIGTFTQVNSITESIQNTTTISPAITLSFCSVLVAIAVLVGLKSISKVSTTVVPFMAIIYILGTLTVISLISGKFLLQSL